MAGMATMLSGMVGQSITLVMKPNGDVIKVKA